MKTGAVFGRLGCEVMAAALIANAWPCLAQEPGSESLQSGPTRHVPTDAGATNAPLLFCIGMHIEPFGATPSKLVEGAVHLPPRAGPSYELPGFFRHQVADIRRVAAIVEHHSGWLTIQAQTPFTRVAAESGEPVLADLALRGHEVALHFHEDAHLGRGSERLPASTWTAVMREELDWLAKAGAPRVRHWSGGNLYPGLMDAAAQAGLDVMSDYKNPRRQESDPRLLAVNPWRPAAGPSEGDLATFARHAGAGKIIYLPDGVFSRVDHAGMRRSAELGGDWGYFDFLTEGLEMSLRAARPDRVNVFHYTVHAGEFRGSAAPPFAVIEAWLSQVLDPLVKAGKVRWATFSQMADEYAGWELANPGVDPRVGSTRGAPVPATAAPSAKSNASASKPPASTNDRGCMTFAVNVHDWRFVKDSAETVLRLIGIFERHGVRGDFYLTAPVVERYVAERSDVIQRLKDSGMTISYHVRAPHPLWKAFGEPLRDKTSEEVSALLRDYETFQLDLRTGALNRSKPGGYRYVEQVFGTKPVAVGASDSPPRLRSLSSGVYAALGAQVAVFYHETGTELERPFEWRDGLLARPSDFSITRLETEQDPEGVFWWNMQGTTRAAEFDPVKALKARLAAWRGPRGPFVTALIHESDFCRQGGPGWSSIYFTGQGPQSRPRHAPFDLDTPATSTPRPAAVRDAIFMKYEELVACTAERLHVVTSADIAAMAKPGRASVLASPNSSENRPQPGLAGTLALPAGRAEPIPAAARRSHTNPAAWLYIAGTMHIETRRQSWPEPDALLGFFKRATATGMRWSIGADIGWLEGEPRAGEIIRATEALGVQWDVHAHELADRANCAAAIKRMGGQPTAVASGVLVRELDSFRSPIKGRDGATWQARVLWGFAFRPGHGPGADDRAIGLWRPQSSAEPAVHDPSGTLIAYGSGHLGLAELEQFAKEKPASVHDARVVGVSVMVAPRTLRTIGTGDGIGDSIATLEAWAARLGAQSQVRWATIAETAEAWQAQAAIPSRIKL
jgi:hypothetical protein